MLIKITFPNHGHGYDSFVFTWWIINEFENTIGETDDFKFWNCERTKLEIKFWPLIISFLDLI